mmetsp:Transcript_27882/g.60990  ORF Transcript_27882/g.60990 Transcript_27882/m.60990 type:complete len:487 (-) Transcript_27882:9-1469(-)
MEFEDSGGRPDDEVADQAWQYHKARNDSVIVDLFQGQYKSTLVCPACSCKSVTFDPFMYLSLPLPATARTIKITCVTSDGSTPPTTYSLKVAKSGQVSDVLALLAAAVQLTDGERLVLTEVFHSYIYRTIPSSGPMSTIKDGETLYAYRLPKSVGGQSDLKDVVLMHKRADTQASGPIQAPLMVTIPAAVAGGGMSAAAAVGNALEMAMRPFLRSRDAAMPLPVAGASANGKLEAEAMDDGDKAEALYELRHTNVSCSVAGSSYSEVQGAAGAFTGGSYMAGVGVFEHVGVVWAPRALDEKYDLSTLGTPLRDPSCEPTKSTGVSLDQCIEGFLQEEPLGPDDMWYCPKCKEHRQATKKLELWRMPQVLVVHLKRFSYSRVWRDKLDTYVSYPVSHLDLNTYVRQSGDKEATYELFAVSNHYGSLGGGHYTAYAKQTDDSKWYLFDDSSVRQVEESDVVRDASAGYVLFYWRKDIAQCAFTEKMET